LSIKNVPSEAETASRSALPRAPWMLILAASTGARFVVKAMP
jgi:hypothetical protein